MTSASFADVMQLELLNELMRNKVITCRVRQGERQCPNFQEHYHRAEKKQILLGKLV